MGFVNKLQFNLEIAVSIYSYIYIERLKRDSNRLKNKTAIYWKLKYF